MECHQRGQVTATVIMLLANYAITCQGRTDPKKMESFVLSNHSVVTVTKSEVLVAIAQAASPHVPHAYAA